MSTAAMMMGHRAHHAHPYSGTPVAASATSNPGATTHQPSNHHLMYTLRSTGSPAIDHHHHSLQQQSVQQLPTQDDALLSIALPKSSHHHLHHSSPHHPYHHHNLHSSYLLAQQASPTGDTQSSFVSTEKALGYGAFGVVWSATDPRTGQKVALKRIPRVFHNTITAKRVFRELRMLAHLKHDNIVSLTDIIKSDNYLDFNEIYILCEFMQTDLHKIIVSPQPLSSDHVKIFVYQILRGVKYLHSSRIIHRDIKPGNMLVNSNCLLKICDFGLARVEDPNEDTHLTQEVITQYYRPPELLMESTRYSYAVDIWSVGCTLAELLSRKILFQARGPLEQLELIMNITGTPSVHDLRGTHPDARCFVLTRKTRHPNLGHLFNLGPNVTEQAVLLLSQMLKFNPEARIGANDALHHPYLEEARLRFHSCMCSCCRNLPSPASSACSISSTESGADSSSSSGGPARRKFARDLDPPASMSLPLDLDAGFTRLSEAKKLLWEMIETYHIRDTRPFRVTLNKSARNFSAFINSNVAQAKEAPNSHRW